MSGMTLNEFADKISEVMPVIMKEFARRQENELYKGKITLPQFLILEFLYKDGEIKMTQLAQFMHVSTAAMTGIVDRLVRDHYVARALDSADRRIIKVKLTAKGLELVKRIDTQRRSMIIRIFGKISGIDREDYLRILKHIKDILVNEK
ncbi:MAG: MarR family transcriptional regulator [Candidatus Omnitrophica bacterium]|nr:MarR family transcriptional regulator [Candidatus Omnitrophota bacterium]MBU1868910.1 MarR family transcriptional regulator [Candidatus Omnitrophota bacterium]